MLENRLARNRPVLHEIVLVDPLKYLSVVTERVIEKKILLHKSFSHDVCKGARTERLNARTAK